MRFPIRWMILTVCLACALSLEAQVSPWSSGTYAYDGAGNVKAVGSDYYVYDAAGRLITGSADKQRSGTDSYQSYTYDPFGNRLTASTTGTSCMDGCGVPTTVDAFNHVTNHSTSYDGAGNLLQFDGSNYAYDGAGMISRASIPASGYDAQYIYTADDERIAIYTGGGQWRFTVRDLDGKVIREVTASQLPSGTTWTWNRDHVFRDGLLLASVLPGTTRHYHLDHLGSPRLVTDENHRKIGVYAYYPFGDEVNLGLQEPLAPDAIQFTGQERDNSLSLDYMHARYYSSSMGRFLSMDPALDFEKTLPNPQMWNRYAYVVNNPIRFTDPDGREHVNEPGFTKSLNEADWSDAPAPIKASFYAIGVGFSLAADEFLVGPAVERIVGAVRGLVRIVRGDPEAVEQSGERFFKKAPKASENFRTEKQPDGSTKYSYDTRGKVPGSKATYEKIVDKNGNTVSVTKTTVDPKGAIVHVKHKLTPQ
jgi:RHS repeat-associated protein